MPRVARIVIPGCAHHIVQRGNNRQDVFFVDDDYARYLAILNYLSRKNGLQILGYCLMRNHVHLIAVPAEPHSLANAVGRANWVYTQYINRLHGRTGHLWQSRFYSCALDEKHLLAAMAYIERNPMRAKMASPAWQYKWSSARAHISGKDPLGLLELKQWQEILSPSEWKAFLSRNEESGKITALRSHTRRGRPLGNDAFLSKIEISLGKRLRPLPVGRPGKSSSKTSQSSVRPS